MVVHEERKQRPRRGRVRGDHTTLADEGREQGPDFRWLAFGHRGLEKEESLPLSANTETALELTQVNSSLVSNSDL